MSQQRINYNYATYSACICLCLFMQMLSFGSTALDQFKERLAEWPQYCNHILQISHFRESQPELVKFIERALMRGGRNQREVAGNGIFLADQQLNGTAQTGGHSPLIQLEGLEQFPVSLTSIELDERKSLNFHPRTPVGEVSPMSYLARQVLFFQHQRSHLKEVFKQVEETVYVHVIYIYVGSLRTSCIRLHLPDVLLLEGSGSSAACCPGWVFSAVCISSIGTRGSGKTSEHRFSNTSVAVF